MTDPKRLTITRHAWQRFVSRYPGELPACPQAALMDLLRRAQPEDLGVASVVRMIDNGFESANYYTVDGWRFVVSEDGQRLVTAERIIYSRPRKMNRRGRRVKGKGKSKRGLRR